MTEYGEPQKSTQEKIMWIAAIAVTLLVEGLLISLAYETGIMDTIKGFFK